MVRDLDSKHGIDLWQNKLLHLCMWVFLGNDEAPSFKVYRIIKCGVIFPEPEMDRFEKYFMMMSIIGIHEYTEDR